MEPPRRIITLWLLLWVACLLCGSVESARVWESSLFFDIARRSQRDISLNQTLDQLTYSGINLNKQLWNRQGYKVDTLDTVKGYLDIGVRSLAMDLYWNEKLQTWQFCPESLLPNVTDLYQVQTVGKYQCQRALNLTVVFETVNSHLSDTDTQTDVDLVELFFNIKSIIPNYKYVASKQNATLSSLLEEYTSSLYTPSDRSVDVATNMTSPDGFPTLDYFLYFRYKRVLPIVLSNELLPNSTYGNLNDIDGDVLFINGHSVNVTIAKNVDQKMQDYSQISSLSTEKFRLVTDDSQDSFTVDSLKKLIHLGYSPILSTYQQSSSIYDFEYNSLWSWIENQPDSANPVYELNANLSNSNKRQIANRCAVIYEDGWVVDNCYSIRPVACRNNSFSYDWIVSQNGQTYFNVKCPNGYSFALPRNALENRALQNTIVNDEITDPVWIDLNSITVVDCWVTGGPYATCPYESIVTKKYFAGMITPASVVTLLLIAMIIALKFDNTPVQRNRRHWKKLMNEFSQKDYEGVPS